MIKKLITIMAVIAFSASVNFAQWQNLGAWPDDTYKGGTHGIAVDPDGKVWQSSYYKENWITPNNDTIKTSPIYVFNADGSLNTILYTVTDGNVIDTLSGNCRGMGKDENGNILYTSSGPTKLIKINYQTFARMGSQLIFDYIGSSPTAPSTDENGNIFVGPVVGGGTTAIAIFDTDLNYLGNAVVGPPNIARTMEVSPDGNTIYWLPFTAQKTFIYSRPDEFSAFELTDSAHFGMSIETSAWHPVTGLLWISNDKRGTAGLSDLTWYGYDVTAKALVDSFSLPVIPDVGDQFPRGLDFSPDGKFAYVGLFGTAFDRVYKFTNVGSTGLSVTFEADGNGADWTWITFGPDNAPLAIIPNPDMTEPNTSSTVLQFTASFPGDPWAGFFSDDIGEFTFDETNSLVKVMVWKPLISNFGVKFEGSGVAPVEKLIPNTVTNAWEEITYDFSDQIGKTFSRLVFLPDFGPNARTQNNVLYIDNLTFSDISTDIDLLPNILPNGYALDQNYPNPFNPATQIRFQLQNTENVSLKVFNLLGQEVTTLINKTMSAGVYEVNFDASQLSSGTYIYSITAGNFHASKKMTLLK